MILLTKNNKVSRFFVNYGGIENSRKYISQHYGENTTLVARKVLIMDDFSMRDLGEDANNCVLTGITRILSYYLNRSDEMVDSEIIYDLVKENAVRKGYRRNKGLGFCRISSVMKRCAEIYGIASRKTRSVYCIRIFKTIMKQIDMQNPLLMNISFGYYRDHTVTIAGYEIYEKKGRFWGKKRYPIVLVYDGWKKTLMGIDYHKLRVPVSVTRISD
ncbi:MAG: hypothetical protein K6G64_04055 [Eubacterium sp.]|nr:hypothetical protein [Eubacterium sp.]